MLEVDQNQAEMWHDRNFDLFKPTPYLLSGALQKP